MRHHKPDCKATKERGYKDERSFIDVYGHEFLKGWDTHERRLQTYERDKGRCRLIASPRCRGFANWNDGETDHILPRGKGGSDDLDNLRWVCKPCHRFRHVHPRFGEVSSRKFSGASDTQ